jgi:hypothetical protein
MNPVDLPIHCAWCGGAVTVQFQDWTPGGMAEDAVWACPYCQAANRIGAIGTIAWVAKRLNEEGQSN